MRTPTQLGTRPSPAMLSHSAVASRLTGRTPSVVSCCSSRLSGPALQNSLTCRTRQLDVLLLRIPDVPRIEPTVYQQTTSRSRAGCEAQALCRPGRCCRVGTCRAEASPWRSRSPKRWTLRSTSSWSASSVSGVGEREVEAVEAGVGEMLIDTLSSLADGLNVDIAFLFRDRTDDVH